MDTANALNAFITIVEKPEPPLPGPLAGMEFAVKDLIATAGVRTTAGSRILADWVPKRDAPVVRALKRAGGVMVGKTNTHEFAYGTTNDNPHYGPTRNPWNPALTTGGSSGGSAAAVAAGIVPLALGTDTAGSVRIPAAFCGAVGLKPTYGLLPTRGVIPLAASLDTVGPIARTVGDAALALAVMTGRDYPGEMAKVALRGLRVGVPEHFVFERVDEEIAEAVREALRVLAALGCVVTPVRIKELDGNARIGIGITRAEAATYHRKWFPERAAEYGADVRAKLEVGQTLPAKEYLIALEDRAALERAVRRHLRKVDLLAGPTLPIPAFENRIALMPGPDGETPAAAAYRLTYPWSIARVPAITVPCALTRSRLPIGLQLAAGPRREAVLLAAAQAFERARGPWPAPNIRER